jgi:integrase
MDTGQMRSLARSIHDGRSEATIAEYERAAHRLAGQHWHTYATARNVSKRYGYLLRAAYRYRLAGQLLDALRQSDRARKAGDRDAAVAHRHQAEQLARTLEAGEPSYQPPGPVRSRKASKRRSLARLPEDWQARVVGQLKEEDRLPAVVLALTGCRPAEFRTGVLLEREGDDLKATILGAKVSELTDGGQAERVLVFDGQDVFARWLLDLVDQGGGRIGAAGDLSAWRKRFSRAAARAGFKGISPYSLRHQFSSDQKEGHGNNDRLSQALGHASERSRQHYGHSLQGKGRGGALKAVTASRDVRHRPEPAPAPAPDTGPSLG